MPSPNPARTPSTATPTNLYETARWTRGITSPGVLILLWRNSDAISSAPRQAVQSSKTRHSSSETTKGSAKPRESRRLLQFPLTTRVDHKISKKDGLFGAYLFDATDFTQPDSFNNVILKSHTGRQTVVLEENHTFTPTVVNAARVGYSRSHALNLIPGGAINPAATDLALGSTTGQTAPIVNISGG